MVSHPEPAQASAAAGGQRAAHAAGDAVDRAGSGARSCARSGRGPGRWPERGFGREETGRSGQPAAHQDLGQRAGGPVGRGRRDHDEFHLRQRRQPARRPAARARRWTGATAAPSRPGRRAPPPGSRHSWCWCRRSASCVRRAPASSASPRVTLGSRSRISGSGASGSSGRPSLACHSSASCAASGRAGRRAGACRSSRPARCRPAACTARW